MVFRIQAHLRFANAAARTAGRATINSAISGRNTTVVTNLDTVDVDGVLALVWEGTEQDTGDAGIIYALIAAMTSPLQDGRSRVHHHTCFHGDPTAPERRLPCLKTAEKVW